MGRGGWMRLVHVWVGVCLTMALVACGGGGGGGGGSTLPPAPTITAQPVGSTVIDGQTATLSVSTGASSGLSYQWQLNGAPIQGATAASYTTPPLLYSATAYQYSVVVSSAGGSVTSQVASINITPVAPSIDSQPASASFPDGSDAGFGVHALGSQPLAYQWLRNGSAITGANGSSLTLPGVALSDSGAIFSVQISNVAGNVTSQTAQLIVTPVAAQISTAPVAQTVVDGSTATFGVVAKGTAPLSYQWKVNGSVVAGAASASYSLPAVYAKSGQQISVTVSNAYGTTSSDAVALTVTPLAPSVTTSPQSYTANTGDSITFTEKAVGTVPLSYQWQRSQDGGQTWVDIAGATASTYSIPSATLAHAYTQVRVAVSNVAGTVASAAAVLTVNPNVHIIAGTVGGQGYADGSGAKVRFNSPNGIVPDGNGNLIVADGINAVLRRVTPSGAVTTIAGAPGVFGIVDGRGSSAHLGFMQALARDAAGNVYMGDAGTIRKMTPDGMVTVVAGSTTGDIGSADGAGSAARFAWITGLAVNSAGNLIVLDGAQNETVRMMTPAGVVTTLAGTAGQTGFANGTGSAASFTNLQGLALDSQDNIYVGDSNAVRQITPSGVVSTWAGTPQTSGMVDGPFATALFSGVRALAFDRAGNLYVGESADFRKLGTDGMVSIFAGIQYGLDVDGTGGSAVVNGASSMTLLPDGTGFAFTEAGGTVRTLSLGATVSTLAGVMGLNGLNRDGAAGQASFSQPSSVVADAAGNLYVVSLFALRKVDTQGNVTTVVVPSNLAICIPNSALALDPTGNLYLASPNCHQVLKMAPSGNITVVAGQYQVAGSADGAATQATFDMIRGIAIDAFGNIFVADTHTIRKIDVAGNVTTFAGVAGSPGAADGRGTAARLYWPTGVAIDRQGNLYVLDGAGTTVRKITQDANVSTIAGYYSVSGVSTGATTRFKYPNSIAIDADGNLYIADTGNSLIQKLMPSGWAYPVIGQPGIQALWPGVGGAVNQPFGVAVLPNGRLVLTSELAIVGD